MAAIGGVSSFVGTLVTGGSIGEAAMSGIVGAGAGAMAGFFPGGSLIKGALSGAVLGGGANAIAQTAAIHRDPCKSLSNDFKWGAVGGSALGGLLSGGMHAHAPQGPMGNIATGLRGFGVNLTAGAVTTRYVGGQ